MLPGLYAKAMNVRLRKITRFGILKLTAYDEKPPVRAGTS